MEKTFENILNGDDLKGPLFDALEQVSDILVEHSGPFATNAIIGSRYRQVNEVDEFTKDGINILKHVLVSEDASARVAVRLARFVGIAVDSRCHDGTTTSMLMFCALAKIAISKLDNGHLSADRYVWVKELTVALDKCLDYLENLKITEEDLLTRCQELGVQANEEQIRGGIAYHMAMISSKGDRNLADKIAQVISLSPKKIYGMYRNVPLGIETKEPYILKRQEFDLGIRANIGNPELYNYRNDTQYLTENAVVFATANIISIGSMEGGFLQSLVSKRPQSRADLAEFGVEKGWEDFHEGKRNLIILTPLLDDPGLIELFNKFNHENPDVKIAWFHFHVDHKLRTSFNKTLHYMAGKPVFEDVMFSDASSSMIGLGDRPVKVQFIGNVIALSNLYERTDEMFHPLYTHPDAFPPYTNFCRETEEIIELVQDNITNPALDPNELTMLTSFYRSLTCQQIYDIEVGGSKHEQQANQTVYEDAIGAALSAIDEGVVMGGYAHLAHLFKSEDHDVGSLFYQAFKQIVVDSLRIADPAEADEVLGQIEGDKWSYLVAHRVSYEPGVKAKDYIEYLSLDKDGLEAFLDRRYDHPVLLQAYAGYQEQFKRFRDIVPKLANTSHLVDMRTKNDVGGA